MVKHNIIKMSIMILTIAILGTTAVIINPTNMAYAQGTIGDIISNMTQGNMTTVIDVDTLTKNIKERHPS
jgi:hypothetical protein